MKYDWTDTYLLQKKGVSKDFKEEWGWFRYMIDGKLFAALCLDETGKPVYLTLKIDPDEGVRMRAEYEDIIPGYYMNKTHWISVRADGNVPDETVRTLLDGAYKRLLLSFSKKRQLEILGL